MGKGKKKGGVKRAPDGEAGAGAAPPSRSAPPLVMGRGEQRLDLWEENNGKNGSAAELRRATATGTAECDYCGIRKELKSCTGCFIVAYCGKECQLAGWRGHKKRCKEEGLVLQRFMRQDMAEANSFSLSHGEHLAEFWFRNPGGGAMMNTQQARAHVARAHSEGK
ncbi:hypothetical protein T484DRAFT_1767167 [Baffinella frigidus]|nr:hypothetical protein T484DRAFT_1767167 [Cryptophyta sp. CCMP2293]